MDKAETIVIVEGVPLGRAMKSTGGRKLLAKPPFGGEEAGE